MNWQLVLVGLAVHMVFFYSIFDIYFTSPLVHGMSPHTSTLSPPANRLVLFVADGLRADRLFELDKNNQTRAPYLRDIIQSRGAWGVSHTRVPTETRPGHVALIAGFYEDVSAIAKGWQENPVEFDSVFNESRFTWSWGSPDILPAFAKGAIRQHMFMESYEHTAEDFAADSSKLDSWVFDKFANFWSDARHNSTLSEMLAQDKIILFLHLLGLDTNGHSHKPYSREYLENIRSMDSGVSKVVEQIEDYYNHDNKTAYILTSDHGMTDWGSHGAGDPSETLTPLVAWGSGIRGPIDDMTSIYTDNLDTDWYLSSLRRTDVNQADISPLMASLIGVPFPMNSVGELPIDYLDNTDQYKADALFANAKQMLASFEVKMKEKEETTFSQFFSPYQPLTLVKKVESTNKIQHLLDERLYDDAIRETRVLIKRCLDGLQYYHNYDRFFLGLSITLGFLGWMSYILILLLHNHTHISSTSHSRLDIITDNGFLSQKTIRLGFTAVAGVVLVLLYVQSLPWSYYVYCLLPIVIWNKVMQRYTVLYNAYIYMVDCGHLYPILGSIAMGILAMEIIVLSFSYRYLLSIGLVLMASWPAWVHRTQQHQGVYMLWSVVCAVTAAFPLLPVVGRDANYSCVITSGALVLMLGSGVAKRFGILSMPTGLTTVTGINKSLVIAQMIMTVLSTCMVWLTSHSIARRDSVPVWCHLISWILLVSALLLPLLSSTEVKVRLLHIFWALSSPYILLSITHESYFFLTLCILLCAWMLMEAYTSDTLKLKKLAVLDFTDSELIGSIERPLMLADLRCAYFFVFFLFVSFFGTGNIASINSFEPSSVYCFLTVFNPFVMGGLMMVKILIPFMVVTCAFCAIHVMVNVPTQALIMVVLLMSDIMALQFFYQVRDHGSWLDIGTSISHYVIVMCMICFLFVLLVVATVLTKTNAFKFKYKYHRT